MTGASPAVPTEPIPAFVNAEAGSADGVAQALGASGRFALHTVEPGRLAECVREAVRAGAPRIVVAGGDGSIGTAAAELVGTATELAVIPAGTLNHFARDNDIPLDVAEAAALAASGSAAPVDVGRVNGRLFLNTSSVGAYITFVRLRERIEPRLGYQLGSAVAAVRALLTSRPFRLGLEVGGQTRVYRTMLAFIGVSERELRIPLLGGRVPDGRRALHVIIPRGGRKGRLVGLAALAVMRGVSTTARTDLLDSFLVDRCRIEMRRPLGTVALDGELAPLIAPLSYEIVRDAIRVVRP